MPLFHAAAISSVLMSRLSVSLRFTDQRSPPRAAASSGASGTSEYAGAFSLSETAPLPPRALPPGALPSRAMPSTTIGLLQPLQRIFTRLPRTLSSLMVYFEPQDSQVTFMFFLYLREVAEAATPGYPRQIERIPNFD